MNLILNRCMVILEETVSAASVFTGYEWSFIAATLDVEIMGTDSESCHTSPV